VTSITIKTGKCFNVSSMALNNRGSSDSSFRSVTIRFDALGNNLGVQIAFCYKKQFFDSSLNPIFSLV
jgi:hypothetical protein